MQLTANIYVDGVATSYDFSIRKNGAGFVGNAGTMISGASYTDSSIVTPVLSVVAGDYFEIFGRLNTTLNVKVSHTGFNQDQHYTSFAMEIVN